MKRPHLVLGIGELLWDLLLQGARLGGAPANFAVMASRLGSHSVILSRLGRDELGQRAMAELEKLQADASHVQIDASHATGQVTVVLDQGQPRYTIHEGAAWDFMELSDAWLQLAERADAICFGSLAQRNEQSKRTIQELVASTSSSCVRVFDVNLRRPYLLSDVVEESLELATVAKLNDEEVPQVLEMLGLEQVSGESSEALREGAERLLEEFENLDLVAVTRGGHGSLLVRRGEWHEHPGVPVKVVDTIGAGDAFTAAMTHSLLQGAGLAELNEAGNRWGSWVASQSGAMPELSREGLEEISQQIRAARE